MKKSYFLKRIAIISTERNILPHLTTIVLLASIVLLNTIEAKNIWLPPLRRILWRMFLASIVLLNKIIEAKNI